MKQQLSKFFKPITVIDWVIFAGFILLNIAFCVAYFFIRLILAASIKDFFHLIMRLAVFSKSLHLHG
ncbi:MAG: hypothetical protein IJW62_00405 [Clostridia bacterium]|nr:hypothetical protein [Clostridia bacterium]